MSMLIWLKENFNTEILKFQHRFSSRFNEEVCFVVENDVNYGL